MALLGIDIGTTGCKAVAFSESGKMLSSAYCEYDLISPQSGWFELDCAEVMSSCKKVILQCSQEVEDRDPIIAVGISSQGEAFVILDKDDKYLCNPMVSFDARSQKQVENLCSRIGEKKLYDITGHSAHTLFSIFKIEWLKQNQPRIFDKAQKLMCFGDLLAYELTGETAISFNLAARTMLFDIKKLEWSQEILDVLQLNGNLLSKCIPSGIIIGQITPKIAGDLKLSKDVIVISGGHDQSCGALGTGVIESGIAAYSIGTVACITPVFDHLVLNETMRKSNLATYPHVIENFYTSVAFNMTGGNLLTWFKDITDLNGVGMKQQGVDAYNLLLENMPDVPTSLLVKPHFASTGTPYFNPFPIGCILGLDLTTTKGEFVKSLLEGVTYEMKLNIEILRRATIDIEELRVFGGGAKNKTWMQIKADILNIPIVAMSSLEAGCMGAALLAAKAKWDVSSLGDLVQSWIKYDCVYEPDAENVRKYTDRFKIYENLYDTLEPIGSEMKDLESSIM